eukprot:5848269-Heterocapsa_arctica.AAC.1
MFVHSQSGGSYQFWTDCLTSFIVENHALMSEDLNGVMRFPANVPCIILTTSISSITLNLVNSRE